jgi:hypothetical protein
MGEKDVSNENKELVKYITSIVGINMKIHTYWDDKNKNCLDIFACDDPNDSDIKYYGTIGLSDYKNIIEMKNGNENIPIEIVMAGYKEYDNIPNVLSTCGFYISKDKWNCKLGSVFMRMLDFFYKKEMQHIIFMPPFLWDDKLETLKLETKTIHCLLGVPISENELQYLNNNGFDALEDLFVENDINIFNLDRKSII